MRTKPFILACSVLLMVVFLDGCGDEKGACISLAGCGDNFTKRNCDAMNGQWYINDNCADYYSGKSAASMLMISEVFFQETDSGPVIGWVELFNASPLPVDLRGSTLVYGDPDGTMASIDLDGVIGNGSTFVVGGLDPDLSNGIPLFDQEVNLKASLPNSASATTMVALFMPEAGLSENCPLAAVSFGLKHPENLFGPECSTNISQLENALPGISFERTAWPANEWMSHSVSDPNKVSFVILRSSHKTQSWSWSAVTGVNP